MFKYIFVWLFVISSIYNASALNWNCRDAATGLPGNCTTKDQCISNTEAYNVYGIRRSNCDHYDETCCVNPASGTPKRTEDYKKRISALICNNSNTPELKYLVAIGFLSDGQLVFSCIGALISPDFVLTSASCVDRKPYIVLVRLYWNGPEGAIKAYVEDYIPHENFDRATLTNNIALLKLIPPAEVELPYACLWQTDAVYAERLTTFRTIPESYATGSVIPLIDSVNLNVSSCNNNLNEDEIESKICLTNFDARSRMSLVDCLIGRRGPVIAKIGYTHYVVAVTPWFSCVFPRQVKVTRVSYYLDWIENHVWKTNY